MAFTKATISDWTKKLSDPMVVVTFLLFLATLLLYWATRDLVKDTRVALETETRAWVAPVMVGFAEVPEHGKPLQIEVKYDDVGKLPARDLHTHYTFTTANRARVEDGTAMRIIEETDICAGIEPWKDAEVLYPGSGGASLKISIKPTDPKTHEPVATYTAFMSGDVLILHFCIGYNTQYAAGHTAFCYYYDPQISTRDFNKCGKGNRAT